MLKLECVRFLERIRHTVRLMNAVIPVGTLSHSIDSKGFSVIGTTVDRQTRQRTP
jgi:hypothetical protein